MPAASFASQDVNNQRIRKIMLSGNVPGFTTTLAGTGARGFANGVGTSAQFADPCGVAIDPTGTFALVAVRA